MSLERWGGVGPIHLQWGTGLWLTTSRAGGGEGPAPIALFYSLVPSCYGARPGEACKPRDTGDRPGTQGSLGAHPSSRSRETGALGGEGAGRWPCAVPKMENAGAW